MPCRLARYALAMLTAILIAIPATAQRTQVFTSNLYCDVDTVGPYLILKAPNGSETAMTVAQGLASVRALKSAVVKKIKKTEALIKKKKSISKNKKLLTKQKKEKAYWINVEAALFVCASRPPVFPTPTATPIPVPPPLWFTGTVSPLSFYLLRNTPIYAYDGRYLGVFSDNSYGYESIANEFSSYGNAYGSYSIFNRYGSYGSDYASYSPWNDYTSYPPQIYYDNWNYVYLTTNVYRQPRVDPLDMLVWTGRTR